MIPDTIYVPSSGSFNITIVEKAQDRLGYICENNWGNFFVASESIHRNVEELAPYGEVFPPEFRMERSDLEWL